MKLSEQLSQQKFQEILLEIYKKGNETEEIKVKDFIEDIKQQVVSNISSAK